VALTTKKYSEDNMTDETTETTTAENTPKKERKARQLSGLDQFIKDNMPDKKELRKKLTEEFYRDNPKPVKEKQTGLPRSVKVLEPEAQAAWVNAQIEQLNKRLGELSAIRLGTATA
jgi:hypothetical protein